MSAGCRTASRVTQNSLSSITMAELIVSTLCACLRRDGQAELACVAGYIPMWFARPKTVIHPCTNPARRIA